MLSNLRIQNESIYNQYKDIKDIQTAQFKLFHSFTNCQHAKDVPYYF
jgi:hypothetical protein